MDRQKDRQKTLPYFNVAFLKTGLLKQNQHYWAKFGKRIISPLIWKSMAGPMVTQTYEGSG